MVKVILYEFIIIFFKYGFYKCYIMYFMMEKICRHHYTCIDKILLNNLEINILNHVSLEMYTKDILVTYN